MGNNLHANQQLWDKEEKSVNVTIIYRMKEKSMRNLSSNTQVGDVSLGELMKAFIFL